MCIIVSKNKGVSIPSKKTLKTCFENNSDGAGFMYVKNNKVVIDKGYMTFNSFYKHLQSLKEEFGDLKDKALVMHFRIGTSGKNDKATTHPFPISNKVEDLKATYFETDLGLVHNGVISKYVYGSLSDTQNFVKDCVYPLKKLSKNFYKKTDIKNLLDNIVGGRLAILDTNENITLIGNFITDKGINYSNSTYEESRYSYYNYGKNYSTSKYITDYDYFGDYGWSSYEYPISKTLDNYEDYRETFEDFIGSGVKYQVLDDTDMYEIDNVIYDVKDSLIVVDEDYNVYELTEDKGNSYLDLIGINGFVLDKNYNAKEMRFE